MTNHLLPPHTTTRPQTSSFTPPPAPVPGHTPATAWAPPTVVIATTPIERVASDAPRSSDRRRGWLAAGLGIVAVTVVGAVVSVAAAGAGDAPRVLVASSTDVDAETVTPSTDAAPETTLAPAPVETAETAPAETAPADEPLVVLPADTAAPVTTTAPATTPHSLAAVAVDDCLVDGTLAACERGADVVTHVAADSSECNAGETTVTVTESNAVPAAVIVCTVPAHLDDRTLSQAFTLDESCTPATAEEMLSLEVEALVCTGDGGLEYVLVKVAEGQMNAYLADVLAADFIGDFTATEGNVCGGHYRIDGWDAFVFGYGPFVEYRQEGDTDGVRFSRSLCAA